MLAKCVLQPCMRLKDTTEIMKTKRLFVRSTPDRSFSHAEYVVFLYNFLIPNFIFVTC